MTNRKRGTAPADLTSEAVAEMTEAELIETAASLDAEDRQKQAEELAAGDRAVLEALRNRTSGQTSQKGRTVEDLFGELAGWVADAKLNPRTKRLSESTLTKVLELTIGWTLQTQRQPDYNFPTEEIGGVVDEGEDLPIPEPNERITAAEEN